MSLKATIVPERGVVRVGGPEARPFLQNLITNNIDLVDGKQAIYAGLLTPQGKFLFDFIISTDADGKSLLLDCACPRWAQGWSQRHRRWRVLRPRHRRITTPTGLRSALAMRHVISSRTAAFRWKSILKK